MCARCQHSDNSPEWIRSAQSLAWEHRAVVVPATCIVLVLAALGGTLFHLFRPTDIERAEADLQKARVVINALEDEAVQQQRDARGHRERAAKHQQVADENRDIPDTEWLEWHRSMAHGHAQLGRAKSVRRDTLTHLTSQYLRLLAEAESEILRAKDARDRGTPYDVAPRVRDLLAPILAAN